MSGVECNCPWNPDSHDEKCPIYMRDRIDQLHAANQRLEGEVKRLREALLNIAEHSDDQDAIDHARAALSTANGEVT